MVKTQEAMRIQEKSISSVMYLRRCTRLQSKLLVNTGRDICRFEAMDGEHPAEASISNLKSEGGKTFNSEKSG